MKCFLRVHVCTLRLRREWFGSGLVCTTPHYQIQVLPLLYKILRNERVMTFTKKIIYQTRMDDCMQVYI